MEPGSIPGWMADVRDVDETALELESDGFTRRGNGMPLASLLQMQMISNALTVHGWQPGLRRSRMTGSPPLCLHAHPLDGRRGIMQGEVLASDPARSG